MGLIDTKAGQWCANTSESSTEDPTERHTRLRLLEAFLILILCSALGVCAVRVQRQAKTPQTPKPEITQDGNRKSVGPIVEAVTPKTASIDTLIYLSGYHLYPGETVLRTNCRS